MNTNTPTPPIDERSQKSEDTNSIFDEKIQEIRLNILKVSLYFAGIFLALVFIVNIALQIFFYIDTANDRTVITTIIGSTVTTIVGVIIGSSIGRK